jgi:prepilin-type processing-associated H-X9-DG protein
MGCSNDNWSAGSVTGHNWPNWQAGTRSVHPGGANVVFCDGSVRFIVNSVNVSVWDAMVGRQDGIIFSRDSDL